MADVHLRLGAAGKAGQVGLLGAGGRVGTLWLWFLAEGREASLSHVASHPNPFLALCALESSSGKKATTSEIICLPPRLKGSNDLHNTFKGAGQQAPKEPLTLDTSSLPRAASEWSAPHPVYLTVVVGSRLKLQ